MNTKTTFFATTITAALVLSLAMTPAFAAQKQETAISFISEFDIDETICGITSNFHIFSTGSTWVKEWDNGHFKIHSEEVLIITDNNDGDALVFSAEGVSNEQGKEIIYPISFQYNFEASCADGTEKQSIHGGYTMHRDGTVTPHHEFVN